MNKNRTADRRRRTAPSNTDIFRINAEAITSMVTAGKSNPFPAGSPEHIAFAWTGELQRHAASDRDTPLTRRARRIFPEVALKKRRATRPAADVAATEPPAGTPPIPVRKPEQSVPEAGVTVPPPTPPTKPEVPIAEIWTTDRLLPVSKEFADWIADAEGSKDNWGEVSTFSSALGRYQILSSGLVDIGLMRDSNTWALNGLPGREEFLASPALQNLAFAAFLKKKMRVLENLGLTDFVGQEVQGIVETFELTEAGLLAAAHREGEGRVKQYLEHLAANKWVSDPDTFPTTLIASDREMDEAFKAIETRLRLFSTIPLYASDDVAPLNNPGMLE